MAGAAAGFTERCARRTSRSSGSSMSYHGAMVATARCALALMVSCKRVGGRPTNPLEARPHRMRRADCVVATVVRRAEHHRRLFEGIKRRADELDREGGRIAADDHDALVAPEALVEGCAELHPQVALRLETGCHAQAVCPLGHDIVVRSGRPKRHIDAPRRANTRTQAKRVLDEGLVQLCRAALSKEARKSSLHLACSRRPHEDGQLR